MISPGYVRTLAAYNAEMNARLYGAAAALSDAERAADGGAFWHSIDGTFRHLLWADQMWMSRFAGWDNPGVKLRESDRFGPPGFAALFLARTELDQRLIGWADGIGPDWLEGELTWWSGSLGREVRRLRWFLVAHMFNHQTHHRGQAHALLTRAGRATGDTDLMAVVEPHH
jgi:uncharacterized damage-inducible protein DinB